MTASFKTYALKTVEKNDESYSCSPFLTLDGSLYQIVRDIDFSLCIKPNDVLKINLIELTDRKQFYKNRRKHKTICSFEFNFDDIEFFNNFTIDSPDKYMQKEIHINGKIFKLIIRIKAYEEYIKNNNQICQTLSYMVMLPELSV